jgi:aminoglycoside phosphotransferase (APT) family kinase protein
MEAAPLGSVTWKEQLLAGEIDLGIATTVGVMLARIHESTRRREDILAEFDDRSVFFDLRLEPFLLALGRRHPDLAGRMDAMVTHLRDAAICLVHGDFSPKNLLISPDGRVLLIDHEVAHWGDPQFDLAFFLPHLTIKALREAADGPAVLRALRAFLAAYAEASSEWEALSRRTSPLVAAMTLARIDGKSPVEYLHDVERSRIRELMKALVLDPPTDLAAYVAVLDAECR